MSALNSAQQSLRAFADPLKAQILQRFFKTAKGQYGEGDVFIGVTVPRTRAVAKAHRDASEKEVDQLMRSSVHEERMLGILILVSQFERANDEKRRERIFRSYLHYARRARINNWDLVDTSAYQIVGAYLADHPSNILDELARSSSLWERRIAIIATFFFIRRAQPERTFHIADRLIDDEHDLIHKAVGWMLREVGKRSGSDVLETYLAPRYKTMPRTMLRYAIERLPTPRRSAYLKGEI